MTKKVAIPKPTIVSAQMLKSVDALKEAVEVGTGQRGNPLDRFVTVGELQDAKIAKVDSRGSVLGPLSQGGSGNGSPGAAVFDPGKPDFGEHDYTKPPAPTGVAAHAVSQDTIAVTWDTPAYTHHAYTEILFLLNDATFADVIAPVAFDVTKPVSTQNPEAHYAGSAFGTIFMHNGLAVVAGSDLDSLLHPLPRYYWVRFVSTAGVPGPFQTTGPGAMGVPFLDNGRIIDAMAANVASSEVYTNLRALFGTDTSLIRDAGGLQGFITSGDNANATLIAQEATDRSAAITAEAQARAQAILDEASTRGAGITSEQTARQSADESLSSRIDTATAAIGGNTAAIQTETTARTTADSAEATQRSTLAAAVLGNADPATAKLADLASGILYDERNARVTADSSQVTATTALQARMPTGTGTLATQASLTDEAITRATEDGALSSRAGVLEARMPAGTDALATNAQVVSEQQARVAADSANAASITSLQEAIDDPSTGLGTKASSSQLEALQGQVTQNGDTLTAQGSSITTLQSAINDSTTGLATKASATAVGALTTTVTQQGDTLAANSSNIEALQSTVTGDGTGLASQGQLQTETTTRATADTALGSRIDITTASIGDLNASTELLNTAAANTDGTLKNLWTVRMQQSAGGVNIMGGFGLGLSTNTSTGESQSTFLVNANQFAVMGPGAPALAITAFTVPAGTPTLANVTWTPPPDWTVGLAVGMTLQVIADAGAASPLIPLAGVSATITAFDETAGTATVQCATGNWPLTTVSAADCAAFGLGLVHSSTMPFFIDTTRSVVGVRGELIVNGLVSADAGQFSELSATTAFVQKLTASVVNANVIVGQRIVAGVAGAGQAQDTDIDGYASNYIVELNNPVTNRPPLRYYIPKGTDGQPHTAFELTTDGDVNLAGNLAVGGNGVIRTTGEYLVAQGGTNNQGQQFALWIGARSDYEGGHPTAPDGFSEQNGVLWVRGDSNRAGLNSTLFMGGDPFMPPSGLGDITVLPRRDGGVGMVFASIILDMVPDGKPESDQWSTWDMRMYLAPAGYVPTNGLGARISSLYTPSVQSAAEANADYLNAHVQFLQSQFNASWVSGCNLIAMGTYDYRASAYVKHLSMQGAVACPAGNWKVMVVLSPSSGNQGPMHACYSANAFAMQVQR